MNVHVFNEQKSLKVSKKKIQEAVISVLKYQQEVCNEVSVYLIDKETITKLHADYFDDPTPTDCISFPMDESPIGGYRVLGEIFICPEVAIEYSRENGGSPKEELLLYLIHGLLHLMGYDDIEEKDEQQMRALEKKHLDNLKKQGRFL